MAGYVRMFYFNAWTLIFSHIIYQWIEINISHCINFSTLNGNNMRRGATYVYTEDKSHLNYRCHDNPQSYFMVNIEAAFACFEFNLQWQKSQLCGTYNHL
jgi:hypothetical protein